MPLGSVKRGWAYKLLFINIVLWYGQISEDVEKTWSCLFRNQCLVKSCMPNFWRNDELILTMSWVGCLITDSELFILFAENSQILLFPFSSCIDVSGSTESVSKQPTHLIIAAKVFTNQWLPVEESSVYDIIDGPHSIKISQINFFLYLARNLQKILGI